MTRKVVEPDFNQLFVEAMAEKSLDFRVLGMVTAGGNVYPLGTDTKVISTAFELVVRPVIYEIAQTLGLQVHEPDAQNFYPDFTLLENVDDLKKIAIDVKTTYRNMRRNGTWTARFTLGSYTSFLRSEAKNIAFPYSQYCRHYIIGFIYTRVIAEAIHTSDVHHLSKIRSPIDNVEWFVQEKYRIAGEQPGSGNTTNIGSIIGSSTSDFSRGEGPFYKAGETVFEDYWRNFGRTAATSSYRNLIQYEAWRRSNPGGISTSAG
jgi:hypothetical protein